MRTEILELMRFCLYFSIFLSRSISLKRCFVGVLILGFEEKMAFIKHRKCHLNATSKSKAFL